ncbi:DedA family protein [Campylobacter ureolyticus]|uniref:DedA family membrane protein, type II (SNARE domain) n=1 Tax=Campylobacter ureolyticus TaxID=827 RepID=A0AAE7E9S6_9BACT|nr:DedA family protein [Campylobacter ureolyticus]MCR8684249.1 DedA family protein [Campylobacter ureolyticus]QKF84286.1 DedA family membrane protein, type II (SNARE domain) [Campylobacter ureolyticus]QQY35560.1 DedA family protein [Campylobacter ureolyticus]SUX23391.1 DedA family protein [Campylobacter ureolyticus]
MSEIITFIVNLVESWGYLGIFCMMFLESSFFPFPSEVAMIPAGYLVFQGKMNIFLAFFAGTFGSLMGAIFNYYLCYFFGRSLIEKYGKYVGIDDEKMQKFESFFKRHGEISTFNCRLIPGIRQYISLPAGLARMNIFRFSLFTTLGAGIWVAILLGLGYFLGQNETILKEKLHIITILLLFFVILTFIIYFYFYKKQK